jgi:hypothetical protein
MGSLALLGALIAFVLLATLQSYLVHAARKRAKKEDSRRDIRFWDLVITSEDERYSLSRLQLYLWTIFVIIGYAAVCFAGRAFQTIPPNLSLLIGINVAATVASTGIAYWGEVVMQKSVKGPDFVKDIFFETETSLDLPRTQMFIWTMVSLTVFTVALVETIRMGEPKLPEIPRGLVILMGLSHGAYLGTKAATQIEKQKETAKSADKENK